MAKRKIECVVTISDEPMSSEEKQRKLAEFFILLSKWKKEEDLKNSNNKPKEI